MVVRWEGVRDLKINWGAPRLWMEASNKVDIAIIKI